MTAPPKSSARLFAALALALAFVALAQLTFADSHDPPNQKLFLRDGWMLQSSCKIAGMGAQISVAGFRTDGWHATTVPSTVLAALVADETYSDPYFGENLRSIPGTDVSHRDKCFRRTADAQGQPVSLLVVVSHGVPRAGRIFRAATSG